MTLKYFTVTVDIWFHQDSDPGGGPEPYGWIRTYLPGKNKDEESIKIWSHENNGETFSKKEVSFALVLPTLPSSINFYGDVKDSDTFSADDVLAYPQQIANGRPGDIIKLRGDESDSYIDIKYSVKEMK
ncbi:hypothetical protein [Bacillus cereus]|uniref:hypothetical protein n=1 Tax=Bacillus cereus TaxID=1396 RepID=UPI0027D333B3|nr:hypothetical protein [Bacillus cereus]